jgi:WD40 repeat protein
MDSTIYLWDVASSEGQSLNIACVVFSPDEKLLASGSHDLTICLWDAASAQLVGSPLKGHSHPIRSICFTLDGKLIALGLHDGTICLWNVMSGQLVRSLKGGNFWVLSVAFSPDSNILHRVHFME